MVLLEVLLLPAAFSAPFWLGAWLSWRFRDAITTYFEEVRAPIEDRADCHLPGWYTALPAASLAVMGIAAFAMGVAVMLTGSK